jgi:hypothetical protein
MTSRKADIPLNSRLTAYVTRERGAAELQVSPSTWDEMEDCGQIPPPLRLGRFGTILRWRWANVDKCLCKDDTDHNVSDEGPYFVERAGGTTKNIKRAAA